VILRSCKSLLQMQNVRHTVVFLWCIFLFCCVTQAQFLCADGYQLEDDFLIDSEAHCTIAKSLYVFSPLKGLTQRNLCRTPRQPDGCRILTANDFIQYACSPCNRVHCHTELTISSLAVVETIASTRCTYPQRDGQAEWWLWINTRLVDQPNVTNPSTYLPSWY